ncbi:MAG: hypothetical protein J7642_20450 [Cyanobacteria bacterium SBC]|nr:hypothetical protein [Cyanobacteria bacterium SBC]
MKSTEQLGKTQKILFEVTVIVGFALLTVVVNLRTVRDGLNGLGDVLWHITWVQHFSRQVLEGIPYPRWLAGTNYGYGSPTFVFYPPLSYYFGTVLKSIGLTGEQTMHFLLTFCLFLVGFNFYIYGRYRWGVWAGIVGGICYITLPSVFDRVFLGGLSRALASALIPLGAYLTDRAIERRVWCIPLALLWLIVALTHTPSLLLFFLTWLGYLLFLGLTKSWRSIVAPACAAILGFGMAALYLIPAILEQQWVNIEYMASSKGGWRDNMLGSTNVPLFPVSPLGTFNSNYTTVYEILCAILLFLMILSIVLTSRKTTQTKQLYHEAIGCFLFSLSILFLMSQLSEPIWAQFSILQKVQHPVRLTNLFEFGVIGLTAIATQLALNVRKPLRIVISIVLIFCMGFGLRYSYKLSRMMPALHNPGRGKIETIDTLKTALFDPYSERLIDVTEYRPLLPDGSPPPAPELGQPKVRVVAGDAEVEIDRWGSYVRELRVDAREPATLRLRTYYYPAWNVTVNGTPQPIERPSDGTMAVKVESGISQVTFKYGGTAAFYWGLAASAFSSIVFVLISLGLIQQHSTRSQPETS